jgi:Mrp family chromosome partitioning ATPase
VVMTQTHMDREIPVVCFGQSVDSGIQRLDRLKDALQHWCELYDVVLIDLPPILPSADAELLIDTIGQVFVVAEAEVVKKSDVVRARIQLEKMNPEAVGLVVNHVPLTSGGASMQAQLVETITRAKFSNFMSMSEMDLHWQLFRLRLSRFVSRFKR